MVYAGTVCIDEWNFCDFYWESGDGRYDIQLKPIRNGMPGILIELKAGKNVEVAVE